jgi:hypothetical protein
LRKKRIISIRRGINTFYAGRQAHVVETVGVQVVSHLVEGIDASWVEKRCCACLETAWNYTTRNCGRQMGGNNIIGKN